MANETKDIAASQLWSDFSKQYQSEAIALAEAIRLLNKWAKFSNLTKHMQKEIYILKNDWMKINEQYITKSYVSNIMGFSKSFKQLYAYEFCIDNKGFRFHSFLKLQQDTKVYLTKKLGNSKPLTDEEIFLLQTELPLFIRMVKKKFMPAQITKILFNTSETLLGQK